jgi:hypothetical protein
MTVLVDEAEWPWRDELWAHLVSDSSAAELHAFANRLGVRRLAFQDDHYDVPTVLRETAIDLGARPVTSRVLVEALVDSGLRVRRRVPWKAVALDEPAVAEALAWLHGVWPASRAIAWTTVLRRAGGVALGAMLHPEEPLLLAARPAALAGLAFTVPRVEGVCLDVVLSQP